MTLIRRMCLVFLACVLGLIPIAGAQAQPTELELSSIRVPNSRFVAFRTYGLEVLGHKKCSGLSDPFLIIRSSARLNKVMVETAEFQDAVLLPGYLSTRKLCGTFDHKYEYNLQISFENMGKQYGLASLRIQGKKILKVYFRPIDAGPIPDGNRAKALRIIESLKILTGEEFPKAETFPDLFEGLDTEDAAIVAAYAKAGASIFPALNLFGLQQMKWDQPDGCLFDQDDMEALANAGSLPAMTILSECAFGQKEAYSSMDRAIRSLVYMWQSSRRGAGPSIVRTVGFPNKRRSANDIEAEFPGSAIIGTTVWKYNGAGQSLIFPETPAPEIIEAIQPHLGGANTIASVDRLKGKIRQRYQEDVIRPVCARGANTSGAYQFGNKIGGHAALEYRYESGVCTLLLFTSSYNKYFADRVDIGKCTGSTCDFRVFAGCTYRGLMMAENCSDFARGEIYRDGTAVMDGDGKVEDIIWK